VTLIGSGEALRATSRFAADAIR